MTGNEATIQALIRGVRVLIVAVLVFVGENITDLLAFITDPVIRNLALAGIVAVIEALLKQIGGATEPMLESRGRAAGEEAANRPNPLAI